MEQAYDQRITLRAIKACGGYQGALANRMGLPSARAIVSLLVSGDRAITRRVGLSLVVATQDTGDPIPICDVFPELFSAIPTLDEWPEIVKTENKHREKLKRRRAKAKARRRGSRIAGRAA